MEVSSFDELIHAIWEDLQIVKDRYNVRYVKGLQLRLPVTDECGERVEVRHPGGPLIHRLHTSHYRPSCKDYEL